LASFSSDLRRGGFSLELNCLVPQLHLERGSRLISLGELLHCSSLHWFKQHSSRHGTITHVVVDIAGAKHSPDQYHSNTSRHAHQHKTPRATATCSAVSSKLQDISVFLTYTRLDLPTHGLAMLLGLYHTQYEPQRRPADHSAAPSPRRLYWKTTLDSTAASSVPRSLRVS